MAISFVAAVTSFSHPGGDLDGVAWTFAIPGTAIQGDIVLLVIGSTVVASSSCHATTAGWSTTLLWRGDDSDLVIVASYQLTGFESSPLTVTFSEDLNTNEAIPTALFYRGAALPVAGSAGSTLVVNGSGQFNFTSPSRTPGTVGDWYIGIAHVNAASVEIASTPGNKRFSVAIDDDGLAVFDLASTSTAAFGAQTSIAAADGQEGSAHAFILPLATPGLVLAGGVADLAVILTGDELPGDLSTDRKDLAFDAGLRTAVVLSLFLDRRAFADDRPPSGDATDRRGWWGDQFLEAEGDKYGSRLWLLDRSVRTNDTVRLAEEYVREALQWMLDDRVVAGLDVQVETTANGLLIGVSFERPGKDPVTFKFAHVWDAMT